MSAVAMVRAGNGIVIASDGVCYGAEDGIVGGFVAKVHPIVHARCVIGHVGAGGMGHALLHNLGPELRDFDHLLEIAVRKVRETLLALRLHYGPSIGASATVALAGWSNERERFETYKVHTKSKEAVNSDTGETIIQEPYALIPTPETWASSWPGAETAKRFGIDFHCDTNPPLDLAARMVCACREGSLKGMAGDEGVPYAVGGFLQMTFLERDRVTSWIAHRWPDRVGEVLDPSVGEPMPAFPLVIP